MDNLIYRIIRKLYIIKSRILRDYRFSSAPYVSGDTFRELAKHIHDETTTFDPKNVRQGDIVFVKTDMLTSFFSDIHKHIQHQYVLITHNSDLCISAPDVRLIDDKVIHWFAQNVVTEHPKITPIPIGLENAHYHMHGVTKIFDKLRRINIKKLPRILFGFNIKTNPQERQPAYDTLSMLPFADAITGRMIPTRYLELLNSYSFVASPPGNGIDCHRTWEALYLGSIPIVKRSACMEYFQKLGLPIWIINDWNELSGYTEHTLQEKHSSMQKNPNLRPLDFDYWKEMIERSKQ